MYGMKETVKEESRTNKQRGIKKKKEKEIKDKVQFQERKRKKRD